MDIPRSLVAYFLLGRAGLGELQRFTQDTGIVADVWLSFAENLSQPRRILLTPVDGMSAVACAAVIHEALRSYRADGAGAPRNRESDDVLLNEVPEAGPGPMWPPLKASCLSKSQSTIENGERTQIE